MSKHTPGPWIIKGQDIIGNETAGFICTWSGRTANARLMAKSPDLLALVKQLMDEFRPDPAYDEAYYPSWALADAIIKDIESD